MWRTPRDYPTNFVSDGDSSRNVLAFLRAEGGCAIAPADAGNFPGWPRANGVLKGTNAFCVRPLERRPILVFSPDRGFWFCQKFKKAEGISAHKIQATGKFSNRDFIIV